MFRSLLQAKTVDRHSPKELAGWTPFLDSSVSSHQCYPWSGPTVASAGQTERGGSPAGPGARSPQTANRRAWHEPLSRDRVDSPQRQPLDDGVQWHVQEKHPERKEQAPRSAGGLPGCTGLSSPRPRSALAAESGWTLRSHPSEAPGPSSRRSPGKGAGGAPCCGSSRTPDSGRLPAPVTPGCGIPGGHRRVSWGEQTSSPAGGQCPPGVTRRVRISPPPRACRVTWATQHSLSAQTPQLRNGAHGH